MSSQSLGAGRAVLVAAAGALSFLIVLSNGVAIVLLSRASRRLEGQGTSHRVLVSLCMAHLLCGLCLPALFYGELVLGSYSPFCVGVVLTTTFSCMVSILHQVLISGERYLALSRPLHYPLLVTPRRTLAAILTTWVLSLAVILLNFIPQKRDKSANVSCHDVYNLPFFIPFVIFFLVIPVVVLLATYLLIFRIARSHHKRLAPRVLGGTAQNETNRGEKVVASISKVTPESLAKEGGSQVRSRFDENSRDVGRNLPNRFSQRDFERREVERGDGNIDRNLPNRLSQSDFERREVEVERGDGNVDRNLPNRRQDENIDQNFSHSREVGRNQLGGHSRRDVRFDERGDAGRKLNCGVSSHRPHPGCLLDNEGFKDHLDLIDKANNVSSHQYCPRCRHDDVDKEKDLQGPAAGTVIAVRNTSCPSNLYRHQFYHHGPHDSGGFQVCFDGKGSVNIRRNLSHGETCTQGQYEAKELHGQFDETDTSDRNPKRAGNLSQCLICPRGRHEAGVLWHSFDDTSNGDRNSKHAKNVGHSSSCPLDRHGDEGLTSEIADMKSRMRHQDINDVVRSYVSSGSRNSRITYTDVQSHECSDNTQTGWDKDRPSSDIDARANRHEHSHDIHDALTTSEKRNQTTGERSISDDVHIEAKRKVNTDFITKVVGVSGNDHANAIRQEKTQDFQDFYTGRENSSTVGHVRANRKTNVDNTSVNPTKISTVSGSVFYNLSQLDDRHINSGKNSRNIFFTDVGATNTRHETLESSWPPRSCLLSNELPGCYVDSDLTRCSPKPSPSVENETRTPTTGRQSHWCYLPNTNSRLCSPETRSELHPSDSGFGHQEETRLFGAQEGRLLELKSTGNIPRPVMQRRERVKPSTGGHLSSVRETLRSTKVLGILCCYFFVSWTPFLVYGLLEFTVYDEPQPPLYFTLLTLLGGGSSFGNIVLYFFSQRTVRDIIKEKCLCAKTTPC